MNNLMQIQRIMSDHMIRQNILTNIIIQEEKTIQETEDKSAKEQATHVVKKEE